MVNYHLVVLVHGLWGNPQHMQYLKNQIEAIESDDEIVCYTTGSHSGFLTYDGIDVNGKRICDEILAETKRLNVEKDQVTKFSVVGYSLGGIISRYAIGYLYSNNYFDNIEPVNFTTFCSPHVGAINPGSSWGTKLYNFFVPYILSHTGCQLFLTDGTNTKLPLLVWMTDSRSAFCKALALFKHRNLYANIINDKRAPYFTAALSIQDPFISMVNENASAYSLEPIPGYPNVINIEKPVNFELGKPSALERGKSSVLRKLNWLVIMGQVIIITPFWAIWMLGNSIVQRFKNQKRVGDFFKSNSIQHLHEEEDQMSALHNFETGISESFKDKTDYFVDSVFDAMNSDSYKNYHHVTTKSIATTDSLSLVNLKGKAHDFQLNLTIYQKLIINNLNALGWNKYPVLIRNTKQTHRAAIVRSDIESFSEGKVIVKHFVEEVFES